MDEEPNSTLVDPSFSSTNKFPCDICNSIFTRKDNLKAHKKKFHNESPAKHNKACPLCGEKSRTMDDLHNHIEMQHKDIKLNFEEKIFYDESEFENWKLQFEQETVSSFILTFSKSKNSLKVRHYRCHRSGTPKVKNFKQKNSKCTGSIKSGVICPAVMKVFYENTTIVVKYQSTHLGHECEASKLLLPKKDRLNIASMLREGIPINAVLDKTKAEFSPTKRVSLTTRQDIYNIARDLNIPIVHQKFNVVSKTIKVPSSSNKGGDLGIDSTKKISEERKEAVLNKKLNTKELDINKERITCQNMWNRISARLKSVNSTRSFKYVEETLRNIEDYLDLMSESEMTVVAPPNKNMHQRQCQYP